MIEKHIAFFWAKALREQFAIRGTQYIDLIASAGNGRHLGHYLYFKRAIISLAICKRSI